MAGLSARRLTGHKPRICEWLNDCDYLVTSDDALIRYKISRRLNESDYVKQETLSPEAFKAW